MFLLVTGASGVGKSTVRRMLQAQVAPEVECVELAEVSAGQGGRNLAWRQRTVELCVQRAVQLEHDARHLLLCGDPVAHVEVLAAPSADQLHACAFCLLDASPEAHAARLASRGDDPSLLVHHQAFAEWMRVQATDPLHRLEVVTTHGWPEMRWERVGQAPARWPVHVIDTTHLDAAATAQAVFTWIQSATRPDKPRVQGATDQV